MISAIRGGRSAKSPATAEISRWIDGPEVSPVSASPGQGQRDSPAYAPAGAGDEGNFAR